MLLKPTGYTLQEIIESQEPESQIKTEEYISY